MSISFRNVTFSYGDIFICRDLNWQLPDRGVACLWGPSGCGKTTLLRLLAGLEKPANGEITGLADGAVSMVFQEDRLLPWLTALENVTLPDVETGEATVLLEKLGLAEELHCRPAALSGGQRRRVALARALAAPGLLLLDEPFNGLDETAWRQAVPLIARRAEHDPVVLVTHIREQAEALGASVVPLTGIPLSGTLTTE